MDKAQVGQTRVLNGSQDTLPAHADNYSQQPKATNKWCDCACARHALHSNPCTQQTLLNNNPAPNNQATQPGCLAQPELWVVSADMLLLYKTTVSNTHSRVLVYNRWLTRAAQCSRNMHKERPPHTATHPALGAWLNNNSICNTNSWQLPKQDDPRCAVQGNCL